MLEKNIASNSLSYIYSSRCCLINFISLYSANIIRFMKHRFHCYDLTKTMLNFALLYTFLIYYFFIFSSQRNGYIVRKKLITLEYGFVKRRKKQSKMTYIYLTQNICCYRFINVSVHPRNLVENIKKLFEMDWLDITCNIFKLSSDRSLIRKRIH